MFTSKSIHKPDYNGNPLHYSVLNSFLNSSENGKFNKNGKPRRVGIDIDNKISFNKHISTHIFRHTHISLLAEQGIPLEAIQDRIGHTRGSRGYRYLFARYTKNKRPNHSCIRFVN